MASTPPQKKRKCDAAAMIQAVKRVRNKEMGHMRASKT
jgi:hypothetical protein